MRKMMTGKKKLKKLTRTSDRGRERKRKAFAARVLGFSFEDLVLGARSSAHKPRERERDGDLAKTTTYAQETKKKERKEISQSGRIFSLFQAKSRQLACRQHEKIEEAVEESKQRIKRRLADSNS